MKNRRDAIIELERRRRVAVLRLASAPVNVLHCKLRRALLDTLDNLASDSSIDAMVLTGSARAFSAGADLREFGSTAATVAPTLRDVIEAIDDCVKPVVAAIAGTCMGGGLELALACHARVASVDARLALPEVKFGLLPGAGGTQRLPRLLGLERALRVIGTGETFAATDPIWSGLFAIDVAADVIAAAVALAERLVVDRRRITRSRDCPMTDGNAQAVLALARKSLGSQAESQAAAHKILDALHAACSLPFERGLEVERELSVSLQAAPGSRALRHVFFAERQAARVADLPADTTERAITQAAVIGAGTMGGGIALALASAGIAVQLYDRDVAAVDRGMGTIRKLLDGSVKRGKLTQVVADERYARICPVGDLPLLAHTDLVIEAAFEDLNVKREIFVALDQLVRPGAILATNTSSLDVNILAGFTSRPQDVLGLHFFSPAHVMRLMEVVRGRATSPDVIATALGLAKRLGKIAVVAGVCDGFIGNRMLDRYMRQAMYLLEEGALPQQVDEALERFGMAMGPFRVADLAGLDVSRAIRRKREAAQPKLRPLPIADQLCELGHFGQKTGKGFYRYAPGARQPIEDADTTALIRDYRRAQNLSARAIPMAEIVDRCVLALVNEGARLLDEGIAARASDIDVVYLNGYGFPRHHGGPMFYAEARGYYNVVRAMRRFARNALADSQFWQPAPRLERWLLEGAVT
ncbi:MAG: enoyl-CoA hydratase/isomerase family protein [Pseudomonadales bacterium]|nr:enoyl-CoA hydratase/isomerase family protein [Pseudomonadales bacterium]